MTQKTSERPWLLGCDAALARRYDVALLDLDGVVYVGPDAVPGACEALAAARAAGMRLAFVTNNAARTPDTVAAHLSDLGVPATIDDVVTSAQACALLARERLGDGARVLVVGGEGLRVAADENGLRRVRSAADRPDAVLQGYSPDLTYADIAEACVAIHQGALWFASNTDRTLPSPRGTLPGTGTLVDAVRAATRAEPLVAGKPQTPLHAEAVRRTGAQAPLVVGDRLDTDIEGAVNAGAPSLLLLTGVTGVAELLTAGRHCRPTYVADDLTALLATQPTVEIESHEGGAVVATCGQWSASATGAGEPRLEGDGSRIDAIRACAGLAWHLADVPGEGVAGAVDALARQLGDL